MEEKDVNTVREAIYQIPENFLQEGTVFRGLIRTRYAIDILLATILLGGIPLICVLLFGDGIGLQAKILIPILCATPGIVLGYLGINGDPASTGIINLLTWSAGKEMYMYNPQPRIYKRSPIETMQNSVSAADSLISKFDDRQRQMIEEKNMQTMVHGEDFEFAYDENIDGYEAKTEKDVYRKLKITSSSAQYMAGKSDEPVIVIDDSMFDIAQLESVFFEEEDVYDEEGHIVL